MDEDSVLNNEPGQPSNPTVARFTPGPWHVGYHDGNWQAVIMDDHIEIATCWHHSVGAIEAEMQANARLIAAAPELYEALVIVVGALIEHAPQEQFAIQQAQLALAKVEGRTTAPQPEPANPGSAPNTDDPTTAAGRSPARERLSD